MHFLTIMAISIEPSNQTVPAQAVLPTAFGTFNLHAFVDPKDGAEHALLTVGDLTSAEAPLVRIHSECLTGDAFGSLGAIVALSCNWPCGPSKKPASGRSCTCVKKAGDRPLCQGASLPPARPGL